MQGYQDYPNHGRGKKRRALAANAQSAVPAWGSYIRREGSCHFPLPRQLCLHQAHDSQIYERCNLCPEKCRCSATPELMNKVCLWADTSKKRPGFQLHSNFSKLAPLERTQMGWPTITYNSAKHQSSYMPREGQIQFKDLSCSQVIQSHC